MDYTYASDEPASRFYLEKFKTAQAEINAQIPKLLRQQERRKLPVLKWIREHIGVCPSSDRHYRNSAAFNSVTVQFGCEGYTLYWRKLA